MKFKKKTIRLLFLIVPVLFFLIGFLLPETGISAATKSLQIDVYNPSSNTQDKIDSLKVPSTTAGDERNGCKVNNDVPNFPVYSCQVACDNAYDLMEPKFFGPQLQYLAFRSYKGNPFEDDGFSQIAREKNEAIDVKAGALDESTWVTNEKGTSLIAKLIEDNIPQQSLRGYQIFYNASQLIRQDGLFVPSSFSPFEWQPASSYSLSKFEKSKFPITLAHAMENGLSSIKYYQDLLETGRPEKEAMGKDFNWNQLYLLGFSCSDADFYVTTFIQSPLIYLMPQKKIQVAISISAPIIDSSSQTSFRTWLLTAHPDGSLITEDNKSLRFIPYEFLRRDFRRPTNGVVVNKDNLIAYLRNNLWKSLGLTDSEIEDYWQDIGWRIPKSPYYFISLIDRLEIDRVLPMEVNPKPDTIIRNMTYVLPIDKPFIPQPLPEIKAPARKGFTVLENGGFIDGF